MNKLFAALDSMGANFPDWDQRILDGSYDITSYSIPSSRSQSSRNDAPQSDEEVPQEKPKYPMLSMRAVSTFRSSVCRTSSERGIH